MASPAILDRAAVAARLGIRPNTVTDMVRRGAIPPPDDHYGPAPVWYEATIAAYEAGRRSPGRPRKEPR